MDTDTQQEPVVSALRFDGRYAVRRQIGQGGKAKVYLARDTLLNRDVAVKVFRCRAGDAAELQLQEAEAKLAASLNHHALTTLFDAGADTTDPDRPQIFLVMEYVPGSDLRERLRQGPLPWLQVCYLAFDLLEGLAYLHEAGFLHRDIKPANVLLAARGAEHRLRGKLSDFGISSLIGAAQESESVTGTAAYLSPEQAEGFEADEESDVYSLGLVLLEAVSGRVAFPGDAVTSAMARLDRDPLIPMTLPEAVREVLRWMTARDPEHRPTPAEAARAFQDILVDDLVRQRVEAQRPTARDEQDRLSAVHRYDILDTPPEEAFDEITGLACRILDVPKAAIALIDDDRIWFKARRGVDPTQLERPTTLDIIPDGQATIFTVADLRRDPRTRNSPLVTGPMRLRSLAAAPLVTYDGHVIGRVAVFDTRPRTFTAEQLDSLAILARIVMRDLELRLASRRALFAR